MGRLNLAREMIPGAALQWSSAMCIGSETIDHDHRVIIEMLNDLALGRDSARIEGGVRDIATYLIEHFAREEELQLAWRYPLYERHRWDHLQMSRRIKAITRIHLTRSARRQPPAEVATVVHGLVADCILRHVLTADLPMEELFRSM